MGRPPPLAGTAGEGPVALSSEGTCLFFSHTPQPCALIGGSLWVMSL